MSAKLKNRPLVEAHNELDDLIDKKFELMSELEMRNMALDLEKEPITPVTGDEIIRNAENNLRPENQNILSPNNTELEDFVNGMREPDDLSIDEELERLVDAVEKTPLEEESIKMADEKVKDEDILRDLLIDLAECLGG